MPDIPLRTPRKSRKPTFSACKRGPIGAQHDTIEWTCRSCGRSACAYCAHHFGTARSHVTINRPHAREFTCTRCRKS